MKWYWWLIIGFGVAAITILLLLRKRFQQRQVEFVHKVETMQKMGKTFNIDDAKAGLLKVAQVYGKAVAAEIEKVARFETAHFTSRQYQLTGTGGMEAHGNAPYYGWFAPFFIANPDYTPIGTTALLEGKGLSIEGGTAQNKNAKAFVIMPSTEAWMMFLANYRERYKAEGGIARWYSKDTAQQKLYLDKLRGVRTPLTDSINV